MKDIHMNSIRTIDRAIDVLQAFSAKSTALTIEEISKISNIPKNTVYRILYTFERRGLVQFDADALTYHPGLRLLEFSMLKSSTLDVRQEAEPFLEELHSLTNETVLMALPEENEIFLRIQKKENENHEGLKVNTLVGVRRPYLYGVLGQAILAFLPEKQIERVLSIPPQPHTQHTVTDAARIGERLKQIKRERVFCSIERNQPRRHRDIRACFRYERQRCGGHCNRRSRSSSSRSTGGHEKPCHRNLQ